MNKICQKAKIKRKKRKENIDKREVGFNKSKMVTEGVEGKFLFRNPPQYSSSLTWSWARLLSFLVFLFSLLFLSFFFSFPIPPPPGEG